MTVETIFKAVNQFSAPLRAMGASVQTFAGKAEVGLARLDRFTRSITPGLGEIQKQFLSLVGTAAIFTGTMAGLSFTAEAVTKTEDAVASFRTIVSDLNDTEFSRYQKAIFQVAKDTNKASFDVAASFEKIAGLNAEFAKTEQGLSQVSKASITLSKAAKMDLGESAESLVGIMNQFSLGADQADRAINVLAAGQAVGAASITQTAESFKNFGSVASGANIPLEQSVGLIQVLGKYSVFGAEAGTKLRGSVLKLQQAGVGYASGQFNINDALAETNKKLSKLKTAKEKDALLTKMFGAENISTGRILVANIPLINDYTKSVTGTSEAQRAAEINSKGLTTILDTLKNKWVNMVTGSDNTSTALNGVKKVLGFVSDNFETIVSVGGNVLMIFAGWKALLWTSQIALGAYNIGLGVYNVLTKTATVYTSAQSLAQKSGAITTGIITGAQWLWNASLTAGAIAMQLLMSPITLIILAVAALIALVVLAVKYWDSWGATLTFFMGPLGFIISLIQSFRDNWEMVKQAFSTGSILESLLAIGKVILNALIVPIEQLLSLVAKVTGLDWAESAAKGLKDVRASMGVKVDAPALNPKASQNEALSKTIEEKNQNVKIDIRDKGGNASIAENTGGVPIGLSKTLGF